MNSVHLGGVAEAGNWLYMTEGLLLEDCLALQGTATLSSKAPGPFRIPTTSE